MTTLLILAAIVVAWTLLVMAAVCRLRSRTIANQRRSLQTRDATIAEFEIAMHTLTTQRNAEIRKYSAAVELVRERDETIGRLQQRLIAKANAEEAQSIRDDRRPAPLSGDPGDETTHEAMRIVH